VFGIWPPPQTSTVTVSRPNFDSRGNQNPLKFPLQAVVSVSSAMSRPRLGDGQENRFIQDSFIFIQRNTTGPNGVPALQAGDSVTYNGENFDIAGQSRGNDDHPFTRTNFGWVGFRMQGAG
jgi:hypothetical protein